MAHVENDPLFLESAYGSAIMLTVCGQRRHLHGTYCPKGGTEAFLSGEIAILEQDGCVLQIAGKWSHACGPLSNGTFEMRWDHISRTMRGFWSEGNTVTKWLWTGQKGHIQWVSQIFQMEGVPMPKLLPEALVHQLFVKHTFFDVLDPALEHGRQACSRIRASSLPGRTAARMDLDEAMGEEEEAEGTGEHRQLHRDVFRGAVQPLPQERQGREGRSSIPVLDDGDDKMATAPRGCGGVEPRYSLESTSTDGTSGSANTGTSEDDVRHQEDEHTERKVCPHHQPSACKNHLSEHVSEAHSGDTSKHEPAEERDAEESTGDLPPPEVQAKVATISSEKRGAVTTVMINNLPSHIMNQSLCAVLFEMGLGGQFDFVYVPVDFKRCVCYGYAFVNFVSAKKAKHFRLAFARYVKAHLPDLTQSSVRLYAPVQGLEANIERYRNSPVMHESVPAHYKPLLLQGGVPITFPSPTRNIRYPRLRSMTQVR